MGKSNDHEPLGGCGVYRSGLVLSALQQKLKETEDEAERAEILARIEALEEELGL